MIRQFLITLLLFTHQINTEHIQDKKLSNQFILTFQYAARSNHSLQHAKATVIWNDVIILSLNAISYKVVVGTATVFAQIGMNYLQFQGNGGESPGIGLIIGNVKLVRKGTVTNIITNGNFEANRTKEFYYKQIPGWKSDHIIQITQGKHYNPEWKSGAAVQLDSHNNYILSQEFKFDCLFNIIPPQLPPIKFKLEIDWSIRQNQPIQTSQATIILNGKIIGNLLPNPNMVGINYQTYEVQLLLGENKLTFDGNSLSDGYGISIGFVRLSRKDQDQNLIQNNDFSQPFVPRKQFKLIKGGISYWSGNNLQIGDCKIYNKRWRGGQCIELDSDKNQRYSQIIKVDWEMYQKLRDNLPLE